MIKVKKAKKSSRKKTVDDLPVQSEVKRSTSSPVYPAASPSCHAHAEAPIPPPPRSPPPAKASRRGKEVASWAIKVAAVAVSAIISGLFSYQSSKSDSEAGYAATVTAVKELQEATKEIMTQQAYMRGELDMMRSSALRTKGIKVEFSPPHPDAKPEVRLSKLPDDFGGAVKDRDTMMEQSILTFAPPKKGTFNYFDDNERNVFKKAEDSRSVALEEMKKREGLKRKATPLESPPAPVSP